MKNKELELAKTIIQAFTQTGYKGMTVKGLSQAIHLSRQTIYKRFGTKEDAYIWSIDSYLSDVYNRIFKYLSTSEYEAQETLEKVFSILIGESIEIIKAEYGPQVLDDVLRGSYESNQDWHVRFINRLASYLAETKCTSVEKSFGIAMTLTAASKGLLLIEPSEEEFNADMKIILKSVLNVDAQKNKEEA